MNTILLLVSIDVIAAKFLECYIASHRIDHDRKSLYKPLLKRLGLEDEVWLAFLLNFGFVVAGNFALEIYFHGLLYQLLFIGTCLFTTVLHLGAAHSSYYGRTNFITEKLLP